MKCSDYWKRHLVRIQLNIRNYYIVLLNRNSVDKEFSFTSLHTKFWIITAFRFALGALFICTALIFTAYFLFWSIIHTIITSLFVLTELFPSIILFIKYKIHITAPYNTIQLLLDFHQFLYVLLLSFSEKLFENKQNLWRLFPKYTYCLRYPQAHTNVLYQNAFRCSAFF